MASKGGKFHRKANVGQSIPTSSMADIAFLLLVFFMVTTIFKLEDGLLTAGLCEQSVCESRDVPHIMLHGDPQ